MILVSSSIALSTIEYLREMILNTRDELVIIPAVCGEGPLTKGREKCTRGVFKSFTIPFIPQALPF